MAQGALKTLLTMLSESSYLSGVSILFGEENISARDAAYPMIVLVPRGGPIEPIGYKKDNDPYDDMSWCVSEEVDVYCIAFSSTPNAQPIDHADAVEDLIAKVLGAFQDQRVVYDGNLDTENGGLWYKTLRGRWETMQNASKRYGRTYVVTVLVEKTITATAPTEATVSSLTINETIS